MLDWLIVGGGIHGNALSFYLTRVKRIARDRIRVLDPHEQPLALWRRFTGNVGMSHLRSPHVQSLDNDPWSISTFAKTRAGQGIADFIPTHNRPSLALFNAHCDWLIDHHRLDTLRLRARAHGLRRVHDGWCVETDYGAMAARNVILAVGASEQPRWPAWAAGLRARGAPIRHVFETDFDRVDVQGSRRVVIVGGGISAAQLALAMSADDPGRVTLLMRRATRVHAFDSDLCWVSLQCLRGFQAISSMEQRRQVLQRERHSGSMPQEVQAALNHALKTGHINVHVSDVDRATWDNAGIALSLADGQTICANSVVLATGFDAARPGGAWMDRAVGELGLPTAGCGYPITTRALAWADGLFVTGPLAELEIGPVSRNIMGARLAAERIGEAA